MQHRKSLYLALIALLGLYGFATALPARADAVENLVRAEMHRRHIPGLALAVIHDGSVVREEGFGFANLEWKAPADARTVFSLHSVSKQFTATGIMMLVRAGKVGLDDPVKRWFDFAPRAWDGITVRHLLSHTSGLKDYLNESVNLNLPDTASDEDTVRAMTKLPLNFQPGEKWSYCNTGFLMLGLIIRKASGMNATEFLRERIFHPLGMLSSRAVSRTDVIPRRASKYIWLDGRWRNAEFPFDAEEISDSGMLSTVEDLVKWDRALTLGTVLPHEILAEMWTPVRLNDGKATRYGFGWFVGDVHGHPAVWHYGASFNGNRTLIARFPSDHLSVIILTNGGTPVFSTLLDILARHYVPALHPVSLKE